MNACPNCNTPLTDGAKFCPACGSAVPVVNQGEDVDPLLGKVIARNFRVESLLGTGGMGRVYKARQISLDKPIVLKVLHPQFNSDPQLVQRFHREARAASRLNHPNSISIIDFGQAEDGTLFMAMELLHGKDLFTLLQTEFPLDEERLARIMIQVCSALSDAHAENIIHRDLKPENIMVEDRRDQKDFVKVLDFGIAKIQDPQDNEGRALTQQGMVCGTPEYMSPEQARGENLDPRSDIYALGVLMFQLVTGDLPFKAETALGIVTKHITEPPPRPSSVRPDLTIDPGVEEIILKCLEKHTSRRYQTAHDLGDAWRAWLEAKHEAARHPPAPPVENVRRSTVGMGSAMSFPVPQPVNVAETPARMAVKTEAAIPSDPSLHTQSAPSSSEKLSTSEIRAVKGRSAGLYMGIAGATLLAAAAGVFVFGGAVPQHPVVEEKKGPVVVEKKDPPPVVEEKKKDPPPVVEEKKDPVVAEKKDPPPVVEEKKAPPPDEKKKDPVVKTSEKKAPPVEEKPAEEHGDDGKAEAIAELVTRAEKRMNASDLDEAITLLKQARKVAPRDAKAARLLGDAYTLSGDLSSACPHYKDFLKIAPKDPKAASVKARVRGCD